jgi:MarR family transcriptional regulator, organic hydroperoxide resistance regulator
LPAVTGVIAQLEATTHRVVDHLAADLRELGLTPGEVNALARLRAGEPRAVAGLQAATGQRPSTLTGVIDRLERRGLLRRAVNPRDRRSFVLELTADGERAAREVQAAFDALEERMLARVGERSVAGFLRVLEALAAVAAGEDADRGDRGDRADRGDRGDAGHRRGGQGRGRAAGPAGGAAGPAGGAAGPAAGAAGPAGGAAGPGGGAAGPAGGGGEGGAP